MKFSTSHPLPDFPLLTLLSAEFLWAYLFIFRSSPLRVAGPNCRQTAASAPVAWAG